MENLILGIVALGCGIVMLLGWLWLSAERDLNNARREIDKRQADTGNLAEELINVKEKVELNEKRWHAMANRDHDIANQQDRLRSGIAELRSKLDESQSKILQLGEAKRVEGGAQAKGGGDAAELVRLNDRMAELEQELAKDAATLRDLDLVCERLAESERIAQALREENVRQQAQLEHWRRRSADSEESEVGSALIQEQIGELLKMQSAFAEAQGRFHDALAAFAGRLDRPANPSPQRPTFELFTGSGAQAHPIPAGSTPDSRSQQQPAIHSEASRQTGFMPKLRNLKGPKAG